MQKSLSGQIVETENVILLNPNLEKDRQIYKAAGGYANGTFSVRVPEGQTMGGVDAASYDNYRKGLDSACADIVVTTLLPDGKPAVVATKRAQNKCFGGGWWMQGGAIHSYRLITELVLERAEKECGVRPQIEGLIGVFRTCAEDYLASTTNLCYVGFAPYEKLSEAKAGDDHIAWKLLTLDKIGQMSVKELHWYPRLTFEIALNTMPE